MKTKTTSRILAIVTLAILYTGCGRGDYKFIYSSTEITPVDSTLLFDPAAVPDGGTISNKRLYFGVSLGRKEIKTASLSLPGNAAYALSVAEPIPIPLEKIARVHLRPLRNYNANYPALSDMTGMCIFNYSPTTRDAFTLDYLMEDLNDAHGSFRSRFYMHLSELPADSNTPHQFIIEIITDNNTRLADTTTALYITQ